MSPTWIQDVCRVIFYLNWLFFTLKDAEKLIHTFILSHRSPLRQREDACCCLEIWPIIKLRHIRGQRSSNRLWNTHIPPSILLLSSMIFYCLWFYWSLLCFLSIFYLTCFGVLTLPLACKSLMYEMCQTSKRIVMTNIKFFWLNFSKLDRLNKNKRERRRETKSKKGAAFRENKTESIVRMIKNNEMSRTRRVTAEETQNWRKKTEKGK